MESEDGETLSKRSSGRRRRHIPGGATVVIDGKTLKVENIFPIPPEACELPQGMTIGPHNQILLGCAGVSPNGHSNVAIINQK